MKIQLAVFLVGLLAACTDKTEEPSPTLTFLAPADGGTVTAGTVDVAIVVENMVLEAPEPTARLAHNEGEVEGYVALRLDGVEVTELDSTQGRIDGVTAGDHTLEGELFYSDGDALDPPVTAAVSFTAE